MSIGSGMDFFTINVICAAPHYCPAKFKDFSFQNSDKERTLISEAIICYQAENLIIQLLALYTER
jgi:hypothetical protein